MLPFLIAYVVVGMVIGGLSGWLTCLLTRIGSRRVFRDALIGAFGILSGLLVCIYLPWYQNTISYRLSGGVQVTSTADTYQHPEPVAVLVAAILPMLYELNRFRRERRIRS